MSAEEYFAAISKVKMKDLAGAVAATAALCRERQLAQITLESGLVKLATRLSQPDILRADHMQHLSS